MSQVVDITAMIKDWVVITSHNRFEGVSQTEKRRVASGIEIISIAVGLGCLNCLTRVTGQWQL